MTQGPFFFIERVETVRPKWRTQGELLVDFGPSRLSTVSTIDSPIKKWRTHDFDGVREEVCINSGRRSDRDRIIRSNRIDSFDHDRIVRSTKLEQKARLPEATGYDAYDSSSTFARQRRREIGPNYFDHSTKIFPCTIFVTQEFQLEATPTDLF